MNRDEAIRETRAALRALERLPADVEDVSLTLGYTKNSGIQLYRGIEKAAEAAGKEVQTVLGYSEKYDELKFETDEGICICQLRRRSEEREKWAE